MKNNTEKRLNHNGVWLGVCILAAMIITTAAIVIIEVISMDTLEAKLIFCARFGVLFVVGMCAPLCLDWIVNHKREE